MKKNICVHGHFYQPPRENPWTGEVEAEESAKPFHDWNERIAEECYKANTQAPILDSKGEVAARVNNFAKISFDIGPTLLSWMRRKDPVTYAAIVAADKESAVKSGGHGNAMAQSYNHLIMPLAKKRDKITQVVWGIEDFKFHYGRKPEGMWLSETAVDYETLNILADQGILYTVLAPHQASRIRRIGFGARWQHLPHDSIDSKQPYRILLDQGRQFHIFFYDGAISRGIAFQGLLFNGDQFVSRLLGAFGHRDREQLVSTATDGESFGHHHKFGEMAIAYSMKKIEDHRLADLTNYAEFLDRHGSYWEVDIRENSSWSCAHGVERWRSDCGCRINLEPGWNQKWRSVLREAFDFVKGVLDEVFEAETRALVKDPWQARNDYIRVMLDPAEKKSFLSKNQKRALTHDEQEKLWSLLEAQKFGLFMYTSCGWFFDDISGIEPTQDMKFAARAMELVQPYHKKDIEAAFLGILKHAKSNLPAEGTGDQIYNRYVKPLQEASRAALHSHKGKH
jgi:alpha-amylase/alpha-mannosidase (GH57 family)